MVSWSGFDLLGMFWDAQDAKGLSHEEIDDSYRIPNDHCILGSPFSRVSLEMQRQCRVERGRLLPIKISTLQKPLVSKNLRSWGDPFVTL